MPAEIAISLGLGLIFVTNSGVALANIADEDSGVASAMLNTSQQIGGSLGTALLNTLFASAVANYLIGHRGRPTITQPAAAIHGYHVAFGVGATLIALAAVLAGLLVRIGSTVVELCSVPTGRPGRPSKSLNLTQAQSVLEVSRASRMHAYIVPSLLTGARTEEMRALVWDHVDHIGRPNDNPPVPPHVEVWRSVRKGGDTKTRKSRRTLALPQRCVDALVEHKKLQERERREAGGRWQDHGLVFASRVGTPLDPSHVRRDFRVAIRTAANLDPQDWTPRELRHSFVSLLSDQGVPLEDISRLVGHSSTAVTELVYRKQIRPVLQLGATTMDQIFGDRDLER